METIQRGDQVYYRGEVWTVRGVFSQYVQPPLLTLERVMGDGSYELAAVDPKQVQRVEQVR